MLLVHRFPGLFPSLFCSIPCIIFALLFQLAPSRSYLWSTIGSHGRIHSERFSPHPLVVCTRLRFYREKSSVCSSLVDSRGIVHTLLWYIRAMSALSEVLEGVWVVRGKVLLYCKVRLNLLWASTCLTSYVFTFTIRRVARIGRASTINTWATAGCRRQVIEPFDASKMLTGNVWSYDVERLNRNSTAY